ncbi:MAG: hypothetical protein ACXVB9_11060 [Bdellovibrionota bacterium]
MVDFRINVGHGTLKLGPIEPATIVKLDCDLRVKKYRRCRVPFTICLFAVLVFQVGQLLGTGRRRFRFLQGKNDSKGQHNQCHAKHARWHHFSMNLRFHGFIPLLNSPCMLSPKGAAFFNGRKPFTPE